MTCVCVEDCAMVCFDVCQGNGDFPPACEECLYGPCGPKLDACFQD